MRKVSRHILKLIVEQSYIREERRWREIGKIQYCSIMAAGRGQIMILLNEKGLGSNVLFKIINGIKKIHQGGRSMFGGYDKIEI